MVFVVAPLLHKYESYPEGAVNVVEVPQRVTSLPKSMVGLFTTTVTLSVQETPLVDTVQVYVVVCVGVVDRKIIAHSMSSAIPPRR